MSVRPARDGGGASACPPVPGMLGAIPAGLVARSWTIAVLIELTGGPSRPHELERRISGISHAALVRRLEQLARAGAVARAESPDAARRPHLVLTEAGHALNSLAEQAERWEVAAGLRTRALPGTWALRTLSDGHAWELLRALSRKARSAEDLARSLAPGERAALARRLAEHLRDGLIARRGTPAGTVYELTRDARALTALALPAMAWELRFSRPEAARAGSDLTAMLALGAPLGAPAPALAGVCALHVLPEAGSGGELWLRARSGELTVLERAPGPPPRAAGHASATGWLDALLEHRIQAITTIGEDALLAGVLDALSRLGASRRPAREAVHGGARP